MIVLNSRYGYHQVALQGGVTEALAMNLLGALDYQVHIIPEDAEDVIREPEVKLTELLHGAYLHGELYNEDFMEWVSTDERHTMLVFGGSIIATVRTLEQDADKGTFTEVVRWFQCQQFTVTEQDV